MKGLGLGPISDLGLRDEDLGVTGWDLRFPV